MAKALRQDHAQYDHETEVGVGVLERGENGVRGWLGSDHRAWWASVGGLGFIPNLTWDIPRTGPGTLQPL